MTDNIKLEKPIRALTSLVRPKYSPGLLLQDDDLTAAVSYTRSLSRMMFRTLFGCGVLCGLEVKPPRIECGKLHVDIARGIGLNCIGDPIEVPAAQEVVIDSCDTPLPYRLWFALRHVDACCVPRTAQCPPDEDEPPSNCTRERDGFEIKVFPDRPPCSCGCLKLGPPPPPTPPTASALAAAKTDKREVKAKEATPQGVQSTKEPVVVGEDPCKGVKPLELETFPTGAPDSCLCTFRTGTGSCNFPFYNGECACDCCDCEWIILAVAEREAKASPDGWKVDHSVRRFVRPVLMRDPLVGV